LNLLLHGAWLLIAQCFQFLSIHADRFQLRCSLEASKGFPAIHLVLQPLEIKGYRPENHSHQFLAMSGASQSQHPFCYSCLHKGLIISVKLIRFLVCADYITTPSYEGLTTRKHSLILYWKLGNTKGVTIPMNLSTSFARRRR
jgi:hypothetical protein